MSKATVYSKVFAKEVSIVEGDGFEPVNPDSTVDHFKAKVPNKESDKMDATLNKGQVTALVKAGELDKDGLDALVSSKVIEQEVLDEVQAEIAESEADAKAENDLEEKQKSWAKGKLDAISKLLGVDTEKDGESSSEPNQDDVAKAAAIQAKIDGLEERAKAAEAKAKASDEKSAELAKDVEKMKRKPNVPGSSVSVGEPGSVFGIKKSMLPHVVAMTKRMNLSVENSTAKEMKKAITSATLPTTSEETNFFLQELVEKNEFLSRVNRNYSDVLRNGRMAAKSITIHKNAYSGRMGRHVADTTIGSTPADTVVPSASTVAMTVSNEVQYLKARITDFAAASNISGPQLLNDTLNAMFTSGANEIAEALIRGDTAGSTTFFLDMYQGIETIGRDAGFTGSYFDIDVDDAAITDKSFPGNDTTKRLGWRVYRMTKARTREIQYLAEKGDWVWLMSPDVKEDISQWATDSFVSTGKDMLGYFEDEETSRMRGIPIITTPYIIPATSNEWVGLVNMRNILFGSHMSDEFEFESERVAPLGDDLYLKLYATSAIVYDEGIIMTDNIHTIA